MLHFLGSTLNWITATSKMIKTRVTKYTLAAGEGANFLSSYLKQAFESFLAE